MKNLKSIINFFFEAGILSKTPRSGFHFLGSGNQTVSEHLFRTAMIGYGLAKMHGKVDSGKVVEMCLFHDFAESRVSDLNYVHQKYNQRFEEKAMKDLTDTLPFGTAMQKIWNEYHERKSTESILAKDADNLEWIFSLKEQVDIGNKRALDWIHSAIKRLKTKEGQSIAKQAMEIDSNAWWFTDKDDPWWVNRTKTEKNSRPRVKAKKKKRGSD